MRISISKDRESRWATVTLIATYSHKNILRVVDDGLFVH